MKWKFIIIGLISTLLIILGFRQFYISINSKLLEAYYLYYPELDKFYMHIGLAKDKSFSDLYINYYLGLFAAGMIAWLVSMIILLTLARKWGIQKINIVLLAIVTIAFTPIISEVHLDFHQLNSSFRDIIEVVGVKGTMFTNGAILTGIGLFLLLGNRMKNCYYNQVA